MKYPLLLTLSIIAFNFQAQTIPSFSKKENKAIKENLNLIESVFFNLSPYDLDINEKEKAGKKVAKWFDKKSHDLKEINLVRNYMMFLIGVSGYSKKSSNESLRNTLCTALVDYKSLNRNEISVNNYIQFLHLEYGFNDQKFKELCNSNYIKLNPLECLDCLEKQHDLEKESANDEPTHDTDSDKDGITDAHDKCPDEKGSLDLQGCPDSDLDGVPDIEDDCPYEKGFVKFNGCPVKRETSTDSIIIYKDKVTFGDLEASNIAALYRTLLSQKKLNTPFIAIEAEVGGTYNEKKFHNKRVIYNLSFLRENSQKRIQFKTGDYFFDQKSQDDKIFSDYLKGIEDFIKACEIIMEFGASNGVDILVQGVADSIPYRSYDHMTELTPPWNDIEYKNITYYEYDYSNDIFIPHMQIIKGNRFSNDELPNLRGKFIHQSITRYPHTPEIIRDKVLLYSGVKTSRVNIKDRHGAILLAINWEQLEAAAIDFQNALDN